MGGSGWRPITSTGGVPVQQSVTVDPAQYSHYQATRPLLGIVWEVFPSDHERNISAQKNRARRGAFATCSIIVVNDGQPCSYFLDNVIIVPSGLSGLDDYYEHLPRPSTSQVISEPLAPKLHNMDPYNLDGDWCVVSFIGANQDMPYISNWWPHPKNNYDAATSGKGNPNRDGEGRALIQHDRFFRRVNGLEFVVTKIGDLYLSTKKANSILRMGEAATDGRWPRNTDADDGGSVHVDMKPSQMLEWTWRTQPDGLGVAQSNEVETPQANPRPTSGTREVSDRENTYIVIDKQTVRFETETFRATASGVISLTSDDSMTISVENNIDVSCGSATITVDTTLDLGGADGNTLLDSRWKDAWDAGLNVVTELPAGTPAQNALAIEAIQTFLTALNTALGTSQTTKTRAV